MDLDDALRELERALWDLRRVRDSSAAWSDETRTRFEAQRLTPLEEAGVRLLENIRKAQDAFSRAQRLMGERSC